MTTAAALNGIGKSELRLTYYAVRMLVFYVPLAYLASLWFDREAVLLAIAFSNGTAGFIYSAWAWRWLRSQQREETPASAHD